MKKRAASLALVLSMILSFTCQAGAVDAKTETQLDAVKSILEDAGMQEKQFPNGDSDYIQMAKSLTIIGDDFKAMQSAPPMKRLPCRAKQPRLV